MMVIPVTRLAAGGRALMRRMQPSASRLPPFPLEASQSASEGKRSPIPLALVAALGAVIVLLLGISLRSVSNGSVYIAPARIAGGGPISGEPPPTIDLSASNVPQGGAFSVRLRSAGISAAAATFHGRDYPMVNEGDLWYAIIGAGQNVGSEEMLPAGDYPIQVRYEYSDSGELSTGQLTVTVTPINFPVDAIEVGAEQAALLTPELAASEAAQLLQAYSAFTPRRLWEGQFAWPVKGTVTTDFGARRSYQGGPITGSHSGVDIGVPLGTPVMASQSGRVAWTGSLPDRGSGVIVDHGVGVFSGYFHLSHITADVGQAVAAGDVIGLAGSTGLSTGPHVHWEIVASQVNVDGQQFAQVGLP